ncbi:hypothetical protein JVU11DRAFT_9849 [Chiua virens]|nr:hypothetical protein JVU11DRAFT_9849 [Chiua virens]
MLTGLHARLLRFIFSLIRRFRLSVGCIASIFRIWFASVWRSTLTSVCRVGEPQISLHASDIPAVLPVDSDNSCITEYPRNVSRSPEVQQQRKGTLAVVPEQPATLWQDALPRYKALFPGYRLVPKQVPATPEQASQRYQQRGISRQPNPLQIQPGQQELSAVPQLPNEWNRYIHPEGNVLFYHSELRVFTESDICNNEIKIKILCCAIQLIQRAIDTPTVTLDKFTELVLNVNGHGWCYYFVDHTQRLLFWVDPVNAAQLDTHLQGLSKHGHIKYLIESYYWLHCEYYPHDRILPKSVFEDLRGMLNYAKTDMMTTDSSSSPFAQNELVAMSDLVNSLKDDKITNPHNIWVISRLMTFFTENQFLNFCGQPCARLNADTPVFEFPSWNHHTVFQIIKLFLLGSPNEHARRLCRVWVDSMIIQPRWKDFVNRLTAEFARYTIFSTVMLAVNFSFLAVPGVIKSTGVTLTQIMIYCSIVVTVASIVFSFILLNVYSNPELMDAVDTAESMRSLDQIKMGMAFLAITHSLPMASLIWSIVLFSVALATQLFMPKELATIVTLGTECLIICFFMTVCLLVTRRFDRSSGGPEDGVDASDEKTPAESGSDV